MRGLNRRIVLKGAAAVGVTSLASGRSRADDTTGITATETKIGSTTSLSGPVSALGIQDRVQEAVFKMINEKGGIAGRQIRYIYYDDGFQPPKAVEQVRRLIESDEVAFLFNMLGTAPNSGVVIYINQKKVPHLFLSVNGDKWGDCQKYPWTMGFAPSARTESQIYAKYALRQNSEARFAILYQNDDLGKDYVAGVRDVLGAEFDARATAIPHEVADPTIRLADRITEGFER
jgi:branched-chain amino acid transport system substrate-binding protein